MSKIRMLGRSAALLFVGSIIVFASYHFIQAQSKGKGKPSIPCNGDGICQTEEYNTRYAPEAQPCPDCLPKVYPPLVVRQTSSQICCEGFMDYAGGEVLQYVYEGPKACYGDNIIGTYRDAWASSKLTSGTRVPAIGDYDNDGEKELISVANTISYPSKKTTLISSKIVAFETGANGAPSWESLPLGESSEGVHFITVGDVDNDGTPQSPDNEIVVVRGWTTSRVEIYKLVNGILQLEYAWDHSNRILSVDIGDADGDGKNEVVVAPFVLAAPVILKHHDGGAWTATLAEQISATGPWSDQIFIDYAKVRDSDNDGRNEIVCGGNNGRLMIWKYDQGSGIYRSVFVSEVLGGFTEGGDVGKFLDNGKNYIAMSARFVGMVYFYAFNGSTYERVYEKQVFDPDTERSIDITNLAAGDTDGDGFDEICLTLGGLRIFDFLGDDFSTGTLEETYSHPYGCNAVVR
jgi:hypothetical protein